MHVGQAICGLLEKVGAPSSIDIHSDQVIDLLSLFEGRLNNKLMEIKVAKDKPQRMSNIYRSHSYFTDSRGDTIKSKANVKERVKNQRMSSDSFMSEPNVTQELEQQTKQRTHLKRKLKGELPTLPVLPKTRKSPVIYLTSRMSRRSESLPLFSKELSSMNIQTHRFIREMRGQQSARDLHHELWLKRNDLKKLTSRVKSNSTRSRLSQSPSAAESNKQTPATATNTNSRKTSPLRVKRPNLTKVTKEKTKPKFH